MARPRKQVKDKAFTIRLPPALYATVQEQAAAADEAMNALIVQAVVRETARRQRVKAGEMMA